MVSTPAARSVSGSMGSGFPVLVGIGCAASGTKACSARPPVPNVMGRFGCGATICIIAGQIVPSVAGASGAAEGAAESPVEASSSTITEGAAIEEVEGITEGASEGKS